MSIDLTTRKLIADCLLRIASGDADAAFDSASAFMGHLHEKDIELNLAVVEALAALAKAQGSTYANLFLESEWPAIREILRKRWQRAGFTDV